MTDEEMNQMTLEELTALAKQRFPQEPCFIDEEDDKELQAPPPWARICFPPKSKMEGIDNNGD